MRTAELPTIRNAKLKYQRREFKRAEHELRAQVLAIEHRWRSETWRERRHQMLEAVARFKRTAALRFPAFEGEAQAYADDLMQKLPRW